MKELFVTYDVALKLKEKGFDQTCMARYDKVDSTNPTTDESNRKLELYVRGDYHEPLSWTICNAPLYQQVIDWFRLKHRLVIADALAVNMSCSYDPLEKYYMFNLIRVGDTNTRSAIRDKYKYNTFNTYYEALDFVINVALELI